MPAVKQSLWVPHRAQDMFMLVDRVPDYPLFVPWCTAAQEHTRDAHQVEASLTLSLGGFQVSFTTRNRLEPYQAITLDLVKGPLSQLEGCWRFHASNGGCDVSLDVSFEVERGVWMSAVLGRMLEEVSQRLVDAFAKRADALYGHKP